MTVTPGPSRVAGASARRTPAQAPRRPVARRPYPPGGLTGTGGPGGRPGAPTAPTWRPGRHPAAFTGPELAACVRAVREPVHLLAVPGRGVGLGLGGAVGAGDPAGAPVVGSLPALYPEWLGDRSFALAHGVRFPYIAGEMATGIATTAMVTAMARAGMLGFFGSGGLGLDRIEKAAVTLAETLADEPNWGVNLLHSPGDPALENTTAALLLRHGVPCVSASAFMSITPAVVRCAATGLRRTSDGRVERRTRVFAKISRPEVAEQFMSPPPGEILRALVDAGEITAAEAELAAGLPIAEDITVEADSAGHTDGRPMAVVVPAVQEVRDRVVARFAYQRPVRVGAAGGLGTPQAVAAAFALGAAYVLTGSVNQVSVESGQSEDAKAMLAGADLADVALAPAADMFELGAKVQVLARGSMFAPRAGLLFEAYRRHDSLEQLPPELRAKLERDLFGLPLDDVWARTAAYWGERDPGQVERALIDPKHRMALVFRWYLGNSGRWALAGEQSRRTDYQVWCGPAMGAFNRWIAGSFLAQPAERGVVQIALNLLEGAAVVTRAHQVRSFGVPVGVAQFPPRRLSLGAHG
ncbi:PfaD family polyunsaturated fatty acid/polyketide biosynthesis protein [Candidatus Frankia alpina]|uniref:PfaD family polyunsaturated fatty acid/polyketide biosynthesis protein n=1 Tax=Candidatus Frankia alpina TaxID=2699483 RepID=A0A4S5EQE8_9ACTN|nr:PfaD family polyunsaturated fatty acid/polyketide biosynthesis protein [Candidatus Frankia alpina]THJ74571.1 PfaD family polyunsaturated fatty acid/polyketide biosynthesis protein [Candidatus Frankia alpina]